MEYHTLNTPHYISLESFEGPLDLLLHLVKEQELDIFSVNLHLLALQYLHYLTSSDFRNIKDAGAFIRMASDLLVIKSAALLPQRKASLQDKPSEDPQALENQIRERLYLYESFKKAAHFFATSLDHCQKHRSSYQWQTWERKYMHTRKEWSGNPVVLCVLYSQLLTTLPERQHSKVVAKSHKLALEHICAELKKLCQLAKALRLEDLYQAIPSRYALVACVISVLQMAREGHIHIAQDEPQDTQGEPHKPQASLWLYHTKPHSSAHKEHTGVCIKEHAQNLFATIS
ncbi:MAG: segregation/condensation protein A [Proteobacteria bacterium]|nr:segregation/condensation protein A [Pseudomonadota bacterium]